MAGHQSDGRLGDDRSSENMQREPLTLFHTSDLHVGNGPCLEPALAGFRMVVDAARALAVDALLIAGDLFDGPAVAEATALSMFAVLAELPFPTVVLPGNHDTLLTDSPAVTGAYSPPVHVLRNSEGEEIALTPLGLRVWGRPCHAHLPSFRPLSGIAARVDDNWRVLMAHGLVTDGQGWFGDSSPISPDELAQAESDYIALGHVHVFREVSQGPTPAFYSGAPSGAQPPTAALVRFDPNTGVTVECVDLSNLDSGVRAPSKTSLSARP